MMSKAGRQSEGENETTAAELLKGCCCCSKRNALGTATSRVCWSRPKPGQADRVEAVLEAGQDHKWHGTKAEGKRYEREGGHKRGARTQATWPVAFSRGEPRTGETICDQLTEDKTQVFLERVCICASASRL